MNDAGPHVLLVDDSADARFLITRALRRTGLAVAVAAVPDGDAAIAHLAGAGVYADRTRFPLPQLVLLDWKLPGRPSSEVLGWIRGAPVLARLPVVVLTTSREDADRRDAFAAGADDFLSKPGASTDLVELMRSTLMRWLPHDATVRSPLPSASHVPSSPDP